VKYVHATGPSSLHIMLQPPGGRKNVLMCNRVSGAATKSSTALIHPGR
jgi:hypothetical protein